MNPSGAGYESATPGDALTRAREIAEATPVPRRMDDRLSVDLGEIVGQREPANGPSRRAFPPPRCGRSRRRTARLRRTPSAGKASPQSPRLIAGALSERLPRRRPPRAAAAFGSRRRRGGGFRRGPRGPRGRTRRVAPFREPGETVRPGRPAHEVRHAVAALLDSAGPDREWLERRRSRVGAESRAEIVANPGERVAFRACTGLHEVESVREDDGLELRVHGQFLQDALDMVAHGHSRDAQLLRDDRGRQSPNEAAQDLLLARRQDRGLAAAVSEERRLSGYRLGRGESTGFAAGRSTWTNLVNAGW